MQRINRIQYISGLKAIACLGVAIGHFAAVVKYAETELAVFSFFEFPPIKLLLNEQFWLYLFFLISGFLLAQGKIESFSVLIKKIFRRFLRLGIPVLFASIFIWVLWELFGMHNRETAALFENTWFQNFYSYPVGILDVLKSPIDVLVFKKCIFNSPFWVLREMFMATIFIYLCVYFQSYFQSRCWVSWVIAYGGTILAAVAGSKVITTCMIGFVIAHHRDHAKWLIEKAKWVGISLMVLLGCCSMLHTKIYMTVLTFSALILFVPSFPKIEKWLGNQVLIKLEKISFGIYSFHWPVLCSIGAYVLLKTWSVSPIVSLVLCSMISLIFTGILSYLFHITAEKVTGYIIKKCR